ncbi:MAG TPA: arginine ABC transporter permease [Lachnospiraceae bacterium]|nr:arginine ABC transporter permease [Lachnospiraceae bacterium]
MIQNIILILQKYGLIFAQGLWNTVWLSLVSVLLGTILGVLIALGKMSGVKALCKVTGIYIEIIRGTPMLLQLYFFWLALPSLIPDIPDIVCILIALVINASAYIAEIIRAGIQAVDAGQTEAALSLGMDRRNVMTKIIFPQAMKNILPAIGNEVIVMIKNTSLASTFFIGELMTAYKKVQSSTFLALEPLTISGILYLFLTITLSRATHHLEVRLKANER